MIALLCFLLTLLASPFKSNSRLEAENAALRHQLGRRVFGAFTGKISRGADWVVVRAV